MYLPRSFGDPEGNYWNLVNDAILCDVVGQWKVKTTGPDAARFIQYLTSYDLSNRAVGQSKYLFITSDHSGIINDPILLKLTEDHFQLSLADSDELLWANGIQVHRGMDVTIGKLDVSHCNCRVRNPETLRSQYLASGLTAFATSGFAW